MTSGVYKRTEANKQRIKEAIIKRYKSGEIFGFQKGNQLGKLNIGTKRSKEAIEKTASKLRGRKLSAEHCEKISKANKGRKISEEQIMGLKENRIGIDNPNWRGDNISINRIHRWLEERFGKANRCENREYQVLEFECNEKSDNYEWSKLEDKQYERKRENFWNLCKSCHRKYDKINVKHKKKIPMITLRKVNKLRKFLNE